MDIKSIHNEIMTSLALANEDEVLFDPFLTSLIQEFYKKHDIADDFAFEKILDNLFIVRKQTEYSTAQQIRVLQAENENLKIKINSLRDLLLENQLLIEKCQTNIEAETTIIASVPTQIEGLNKDILEIEGVLIQLKEMNSVHVADLINKKENTMAELKKKNAENNQLLEITIKSKENYHNQLVSLKIDNDNKSVEGDRITAIMLENDKRIGLLNAGGSAEDLEFTSLKHLYLFFLGKTVEEVGEKLNKENNTEARKAWIKKNIRSENTNYVPHEWKTKIIELLNKTITYPIGVIVKEENSNKYEQGVLANVLEKISSSEIAQREYSESNTTIELFSSVQANFLMLLKSKISSAEFIISPKIKCCFSLDNGIMVVISFRKRNSLLVLNYHGSNWFAITHKTENNYYSTVQKIENRVIPHGFYWLTDTDIIEITFQS